MKVVIAPDKFAGTLAAAEAAAAMAEGWGRARPGDELVQRPMADGGEGTVEVVAATPGAMTHVIEAADASGHPTKARWVSMPDGAAIVEVAEAIGLSALPAERQDPLTTTSFGVGELITAALDAGCDPVVVGLGGSATVDGGAGALIAMGHRLARDDGNGVRVGGRFVGTIARIEPLPRPSARILCAADVTNPLLGPDGAAAVFGPQKGADPETVALLEEGLERFADVVEAALPNGPWRDLPGAGAAGGLGFALASVCGAEHISGAQAVGDLIGLDDAIDGADLVLTGEGSLDSQSGAGKAPVHVAGRALAAGVDCAAIAGRLQPGAAAPFIRAVDLGPEGMQRAAELVAERATLLAGELGR